MLLIRFVFDFLNLHMSKQYNKGQFYPNHCYYEEGHSSAYYIYSVTGNMPAIDIRHRHVPALLAC